MFTKTRIFKNSNTGECAVLFIHDSKYIISTKDSTIVVNITSSYNKILESLGYIEEIKG